jgi:hypothetical protein
MPRVSASRMVASGVAFAVTCSPSQNRHRIPVTPDCLFPGAVGSPCGDREISKVLGTMPIIALIAHSIWMKDRRLTGRVPIVNVNSRTSIRGHRKSLTLPALRSSLRRHVACGFLLPGASPKRIGSARKPVDGDGLQLLQPGVDVQEFDMDLREAPSVIRSRTVPLAFGAQLG